MDPSSVQQHQQMSNQSLENMIACSKAQERKPRPQPEEALKCPRCDSTNTKFCYYNNYSLSQPRYFCKSCRRYWTKGGTLRNVPVGGGCRKNKRSSSSSSKRVQDHQPLTPTNNNPLTSSLSPLSFDSNDLTLALARLQRHPCTTGPLAFDDHHDLSILGNPTSCAHYDHLLGNPTNPPGFLDAFRSGFMETQNNNLQSLYCGYGNGDMEEVDNGNAGEVGASGEMMLPYDQEISNAPTTQAVTVTTMKEEIMCNGRSEEQIDNNRVLWGLPWQLNGDINMGAGLESAAGRASWNNGLNSTWHGLLNSPLM